MSICQATKSYESWLGKQLPIVEGDLRDKHQLLEEDPFSFLRGTFYRWLQRFPELCPEAWQAPKVLAVGDLHVANFGTWRDEQGELVWGINDFDEAALLPYALDLVRLATSLGLARSDPALKIKIDLAEACEAILEGYREGLEKGGEPFVVDKHREWLREAYAESGRSPDDYWNKLRDEENEVLKKKRIPSGVIRKLEAALGSKDSEYEVRHRRKAGVGSLGRPRYTAVAQAQEGFRAREAKALIASAAVWAKRAPKGERHPYEQLLARAVRRRDPRVRVYKRWVVRALGPDSRRIEFSELGPVHDERRLLRAMGWETANVHLGTHEAIAAVLEDLKQRDKGWLERDAQRMIRNTTEDWSDWKNC